MVLYRYVNTDRMDIFFIFIIRYLFLFLFFLCIFRFFGFREYDRLDEGFWVFINLDLVSIRLICSVLLYVGSRVKFG